jgi:hypothetical protein
MWRRVDLPRTDFSEESIAPIIKVEINNDLGK